MSFFGIGWQLGGRYDGIKTQYTERNNFVNHLKVADDDFLITFMVLSIVKFRYGA